MTTAVSSVLDSSQITSLIQQAETAYAQPVVALQAQEQPIQTQISDLGRVQSSLSSLQSALVNLSDLSSLAQRSVTASPTGIVSATASNTAAPGTYALTGIQLAQPQTLVSSGFASASATLGSGSIAIKIGGGSASTISVASGQSSLQGIASAINQANAGVDAEVLYNGSSYYLELTGENAGTANAFTISGGGALASLNYTGSSGASGGFGLVQKAENASVSVNGFTITSGSNTISGAVQGMTFTLAASGSATVEVTASNSALTQAASGVVAALNGVLATIKQYASYSTTSGANTTSGAGALFGNVGLEILQDSLIDAIQTPAVSGAAAGSGYSSLAAAGFSITSGGAIALNTASFQTAAQSDYSAVSSLVQSLYGTLSSVVTTALSSGGGGVVGNINSLDATITSMNKQLAVLEQQADAETLALTQQYDNAEATLAQLQTTSDFLSTYFNETSGSSGG